MMTVFPTPAPPNRPIFPPFTKGAIRSMTLIPVSNTSVLGSRSTNFGVSRWIGQRSASGGMGSPSSTGSPRTLQTRPHTRLAHGHRDRLARIRDGHAAHHAVGRGHRHRANLVAPDVLLHFGGQPDRRGAVAAMIDPHGIVDFRPLGRAS